MAADKLQLKVILSALDKATAPLKRIQGGSIGAAKALKETRDKLKELNNQQKDVSAWRAQRAESEKTAWKLKDARSEVKELAQAMAEGAGDSKELTAEFKRAVRAATELKASHSAEQVQLQGLRDKLSAAGISTRKLSQGERDLKANITATTSSIEKQENRLKRITTQQKRLTAAKSQYQKTQGLAASMAGTGAAGLATGSGMLYAGARLMAPGVEYGAQMSELQAVTRLDKGDERFTALKQQARDLGASTAFSATDVGAGQTFLARAGFTPEAINASMQDVLNLALANGVDLARTADIASNISSAFKIDPEVGGNITRVTDVLSGAAARANVDLEMLGDTMKYMGSAEGLGLSLEQAATMAGLLGNIGVQGSQAGTTMRAMLNRLTAPAKSGQDSIAALSLQVSDASGNLRAMPDILQDVATATAKMGNIERAAHLKNIFGEEAGSGMAELIAKQGTGALTKLLGELQNVAGENAKMAATRADNIDGDLKGMRSAWEEVGIGITDVNEGPLREFVQSITGVIRSVGQWIKANPELVGQIVKTAAGLGILIAAGGAVALTLASILGPIAMVRYGMALFTIKGGGLIGMLWSLGKTAMPLVAKGILLISGAVRGISIALWGLAANPVFLVIAAAVAVLAGAAYLIWRNWDTLGPKFAAMWEGIKAIFVLGTGQIVGFFTNALGQLAAMPEKFAELGVQLMHGLARGITNALGSVKSAVTGAGDQAIGWFKEKLGIHSPSRVFAELGGFTMAGLGQGLAGGEGEVLKQIAGTAQGVASAGSDMLGRNAGISFDSRPPLAAGAGAGGAGGGNTYNFTINAAPGMDASAIGREVQRQLAAAQQQQQAKQRGRLSDLD